MSQRVGLDDFYSIPDAPAAEINDGGVVDEKSGLPLPSADHGRDVAPYDPSKNYLGDFWRAGFRVTIAGPMKHGKTSFLMEAAAAVARGDDFIGFHGAGVPVAYVDTEMGDQMLWQAMEHARLPRTGSPVHAVSIPGGLQLDTNRGHRRYLQRLCEQYPVVIVDPWHKMLEQEMNYDGVGPVVRWLDRLKGHCSETCMVIGFHAHEPPTKRAEIDINAIVGFKAYQRNADMVLTIQRVETNVTRIKWVVGSGRSPNLGIGFGEKWRLEWERGAGFSRGDDRTNAERLYALVTDEWQPTSWLCARFGWDPEDKGQRSNLLRLLGRLEIQGRIEARGSSKGGRGAEKSWRRRDPNQEVLGLV